MDVPLGPRPPRDFTLLLGLQHLVLAWDDLADRQVYVHEGGFLIVRLERFVALSSSSALCCCNVMWSRLWSNACRHAFLLEFDRPGYYEVLSDDDESEEVWFLPSASADGAPPAQLLAAQRGAGRD